MKQVIFTQSYRGVLTDEKWYDVGTLAELPDDAALDLTGRGIVELVSDAPEPDEYGPVPKPNATASTLYEMSLKDLRASAKRAGIKGYSRMKRETLIDRLS